MFSIIIKPVARNMLGEIYSWYEEQLPGLGEKFLTEVDSALKKLELYPSSYSLLKENYRQKVLKRFPYKIIFEISGQEVIVYSVFHTKRNQEQLFH